MVTTKLNTKANEIRLLNEKNSAVVWRETTNDNNETKTTFVVLGKINKNEVLPVLKAAINSIVSDETIINEIKEKFDFVKDEEGNIVTTTAKDGTTINEVFNTPAIKRLIANFGKDYFLGYINNEGALIPLLNEKTQNLKSLLCLSARKIAEIWKKPSANRRAEIHTLAKFALEASKRENKFFERRKLLEEAPAAAKNETKKNETKKEKETQKAA